MFHRHRYMRTYSLSIAAVLVGCCLCVSAGGVSNPSSPSVTLDLIVKFAADSDPGRIVGQALKENPTDLRAMTDIQERLHADTGVTMEAQRITSGAELLLRIPEEPLLEMVRRSLEQQPSVSAARLMAVQHDNPNLPEGLVVVEFPAASDEAALMSQARDDPGRAEQLHALAVKLCAPSGVPVRGEAGTDKQLIVTVDRAALLRKLVAQLNDLDYVDYAQANSGVQIMK